LRIEKITERAAKINAQISLCRADCRFREARARLAFTCAFDSEPFNLMIRLTKVAAAALCGLLIAAVGGSSAFTVKAWPGSWMARKNVINQDPQQSQPDPDDQKSKQERKRERREREQKTGGETATPQTTAKPAPKISSEFGDAVDIVADTQTKTGDLFVYEGYVNVSAGEIRLQADHVTFNSVTGDMTAEGNVIFDQGADQRVTARRAEINWKSKRGTFWETTGFTNRTQTGEYVFFTAARVEKTGQAVYELYDADVTACEDVIPKWGFHARRAELKMGDRITLHNSVFHIKTLPAFVLPYAWIPATRKERKSGFLLPATGTSTQKGRTLKLAYYQTLGDSADITFRTDVYTARGLGFGADFRAQTDERSYMRLGIFAVKDRLFGPAGVSQGGTAFVGEGQQYLPHGWVAVGNVSLVTNLQFRQVFSEDISQVIDPRRESTFYAYNNTPSFSFNFLAKNETTTLFRPSRTEANAGGGSNVDVKIRQAPQIDMTFYPRRILDNLPIYFSFDSSIGALKRVETVDNSDVFVTPAAVQRFDFQPKLTIPLATIAGVAITPSFSFRETYYTSSLDPLTPRFDPDKFATSLADPRLDPASATYDPTVRLFNLDQQNPVLADSQSRHYTELAVDVRPPSLEKTYTNDDGTPRFKHLIEPYITYRLIRGVGDEFNNILRFDERDAVANTNEFEYALVNRFYTQRNPADINQRRNKRRRGIIQTSPDMEPVVPGAGGKKNKKKPATDSAPPASQKPPAADQPSAQAQAPASSTAEAQPVNPPPANPPSNAATAPANDAKGKQLERGESAEMAHGGETRAQRYDDLDSTTVSKATDAKAKASTGATSGAANDNAAGVDATEGDAALAQSLATNVDAPPQAYEFLTIKLAQKYFIDRTFGGALVEGQRNQFYPINTLSGFTFGGRARSFSPVNVSVRYRPLSSVYADLRMDVGAEDGAVRNAVVGAGFRADKFSVSASYYLSRRIEIAPNSFEPGTFPGNQADVGIDFGDGLRGWYGGTRISYDFTDRFISAGVISNGRLLRSRSYFGHAWDCCGVQFNYGTFKAGLRNESAFSVTFTLAGLGSIGTDQFGGAGGNTRKAKKRLGNNDF
jgi:lipopolysaccharide assembly outer membrane protein LptD (OstA)